MHSLFTRQQDTSVIIDDVGCIGDFQDARMENFEDLLKVRIRSALDPSLQTISEETSEDILSSLVRVITYLDAIFRD